MQSLYTSSSSSSSSSSPRSSPDRTTVYRTIPAPITAFKMWRADNQHEFDERFPDKINNPNGMYVKMKGYWRYHVSQEEKDHYYEMEAEIKTGVRVEKPMDYGRKMMEREYKVEAREPSVEHNFAAESPAGPQEHIKRPMNAFMVWCREARKSMMKKERGMTAPDICRRLGENWKKMSEREKKPYYEQAEQLKEEHQKMYPDYKFQPKKLMAHLESMNRRHGRSFNPIYRTPLTPMNRVSKPSETVTPSMTPILNSLLNKPTLTQTPVPQNPAPLAPVPAPVPAPAPESHQVQNRDPKLSIASASWEQRYDYDSIPMRYKNPESVENFWTYSDIPMVLGSAELPVFF